MLSVKSTVFVVIVTIALIIPAVASHEFSARLNEANMQLRRHTIDLPEFIGQWQRKHSNMDSRAADAVRLEYTNHAQGQAFVVARKGSVFGTMHDVYDCLLAVDATTSRLGSKCIHTSRGDLHASLVRAHVPSKFLSLIWFENSSTSEQDRWGWRKELLKNAFRVEPIYYQIEVSIRESSDTEADIEKLEQLARAVYLLRLERMNGLLSTVLEPHVFGTNIAHGFSGWPANFLLRALNQQGENQGVWSHDVVTALQAEYEYGRTIA